jgi:hypothetical protein
VGAGGSEKAVGGLLRWRGGRRWDGWLRGREATADTVVGDGGGGRGFGGGGGGGGGGGFRGGGGGWATRAGWASLASATTLVKALLRLVEMKRRGWASWLKISYVRRLSWRPSEIRLCPKTVRMAVGYTILCPTVVGSRQI